jgi:hypothetical protein
MMLAIVAAPGPKRRIAAKIMAKLTEMNAFLGNWMVKESETNISKAKNATSSQGSTGFISRLATRTTNAAAYML